jgi:hypothetical protein
MTPSLQENLDGQTDLLAANVPWTSLGFPELTASELPPCGFNASVPTCTRAGKLFRSLS